MPPSQRRRSTRLSGNKRKDAPEKADSDDDTVTPELIVPGSGDEIENHHEGNEEPVAAAEGNQQQETEKERDSKFISAILQELPHKKNVHDIVESFDELADLMCAPKPPDVHEANAVFLLESCGPGVVVFLMRSHKNERTIQAAGVRVLGNFMACYPDKDLAENCVATIGGIEVTIDAMKSFSDHKPTQENGCHFFLCLSSGPINVKQKILEEGGIACICNAMKTHSDDKDTQYWGCKALNRLKNAFPQESKEAIWKAKGVSAIAGAREHFPDDAKIKTVAKKALEGLWN